MSTEWKLDTQLNESLKRIEDIVYRFQHPKKGVQISSVKVLWNTIPNVSTGNDIITWLMNDMVLDSRTEALNVARIIAKYGYIFVAMDSKLTVRDDLTYHRFQSSFFWPTKERAISNNDYAIHLCKRLFSNKNRSNLEVYEMDQFSRLQRHLAHQWENIWIQAENEYKSDKKKCKAEQLIIESQERGFWNLHKPSPNSDYVLAADPLKFKKKSASEANSLINSTRYGGLSKRRLSMESNSSDSSSLLQRIEPSNAIESLITYCNQYQPFDPMLRNLEAGNHASIFHTSEVHSSSESIKNVINGTQTERWSLGLEELLRDPEGVVVFLKHLEKEHSSENLRFWLACEEFRACPLKRLKEKAELIYKEYLSRKAFYQVNLDSRLMLEVREGTSNLNHFTFLAAQQEIFRLMRSDSYPRFLKSESYQSLVKESLSPAQKGQKKGLLSMLTSPQHKI